MTATTTGESGGDIVVRESDGLEIVGEDLTPDGVVNVTGLVAASGIIDVILDATDAQLVLLSGLIATRASGQRISLVADDMDFKAGEDTIAGSGELILKSARDTTAYRLGSAAETWGGYDISEFSPDEDIDFDGQLDQGEDLDDNGQLDDSGFDLSMRDLAAFADGFARIDIGHQADGVRMIIGDVENATRVKGSGEPRVVNAAFTDHTRLFADQVQIRGDLQAPGERLALQVSGNLEVFGKNLHDPMGLNDAGASAGELLVQVGEQMVVGGWLVGEDALTVTVAATTGNGGLISVAGETSSLITDVGSLMQVRNDGASLTVDTVGSQRIAGQVEARGAGSALALDGAALTLLEGGILDTTGAGAVLTAHSGAFLHLEDGSAVMGGAAFDSASGSPVAYVTGAGAAVSLTAEREVWVAGSVTSAGALEVTGQGRLHTHADYFDGIAAVDPDHPLVGQRYFGLLVTGTITALEDNATLTLSSQDDLLFRGNVNVTGDHANLVLHSDTWVYYEGFANVANNLTISAGGANAGGVSVYLHATSRLATNQAGSAITITAAEDVELYGAVVAGGSVGASGVTFAGPDSSVAVTAGGQLHVDSGVMAPGSVTLSGGTADGDDAADLGLVLGTASGVTVAGSTTAGTGGVVRLESATGMEVMGRVVAGANIAQSFDGEGHLLGETFQWSEEASVIQVVAAGQAFIGGHAEDSKGQTVEVGGLLHATAGVEIDGGASADRVGVYIQGGSVVAVHQADGGIVVRATDNADIQGMLVAGGDVATVRDARGGFLGRQATTFGGASTLRVEADRQIRLGTALSAGKSIDFVGGADPGDPTVAGIRVLGSAQFSTWLENSTITLNAPGAVEILAPAHINEAAAAGWVESADGRLGDDVTLRVVLDKVDFEVAGAVTISAAATADNTTLSDLMADIQAAFEGTTFQVTRSDNPDHPLGSGYAMAGEDPDVQVKLRNGHLLITTPYGLTLGSDSSGVERLGFTQLAEGALEAGRVYAMQAAGAGSTITLGAPDGPNGKLYIGGKIQAHSAIALHSGNSADGTDIDLDWTGVLETLNGSIDLNAGVNGEIKGDLIAGGTGSDIRPECRGQWRDQGGPHRRWHGFRHPP